MSTHHAPLALVVVLATAATAAMTTAGCAGTTTAAAVESESPIGREGASSGGFSRVSPDDGAGLGGGLGASSMVGIDLGDGASGRVSFLVVPSTVRGHLRAGDPLRPDNSGSVMHEYSFVGTAGEEVTIDMVGGEYAGQPSSHLDSYLYLLRDGVEITHDDDGGGNLNSRISLALPASGRYTIRATNYGGGLREADYTLSLRPGR